MFLGAVPTTGLQVCDAGEKHDRQAALFYSFLFHFLNVYPFLVKGEEKMYVYMCWREIGRDGEREKRDYLMRCVSWVWKPRTKQHLMNDLAAGPREETSKVARRAAATVFSKIRIENTDCLTNSGVQISRLYAHAVFNQIDWTPHGLRNACVDRNGPWTTSCRHTQPTHFGRE